MYNPQTNTDEMDRLIEESIERYMARTGGRRPDVRAALIDMDGTLYDSMPNHARAWSRLMAEEGIKADYEEFFMYEGRTGASTITLLYERQYGRKPDDDYCRRLYKRKTEIFVTLPPVEVMPGAPFVLSQFKEAGLECVLVTGSGQNSLLSRIAGDYPGVFGDKRVTSADVTHGKPHPEPFLKAMRMAGVEPWQAVVLENAPLGVESAFRAGAFTIGVTTGPIDRGALAGAGADIVFDSMQQCADNIVDLLKAICRMP